MLFHYQQNRSKYICRQPENADQFTRVFFIGRGPNETSRPLLQDRPENGSKRCDLPLNDQGPSNEYYKADSVEIHRNPHTVDSTKPNFIKVNGLIDEQDARRSETQNLNKTFNGQDIGDIGDYYKSGNRSDQVLPENYSNRASLSKTFAMGERHSVGNQKKSYQKGKKQAKSNHHGKGPLHRKAFDAQLNSFQQNNSDRQWNTGHVQQRSRNVSDCASGGFSRANMSLCEQPSSSGSSSQIGSCYDNHHHRGCGDHRYQPQNEYQLYQDREMANKTLNQTQCQFYENKTFHQGLCQNQTIAGRWIRHGEYQHVVNQRARQGQRQNQGTASGSFHWNQHQQLTNQSFHQRQHQDAHHKFDPSGNEGVGEKSFLHDAAINSRIEGTQKP
uniref:Uncharacterized protein n=1 Tax=Caenorhabditis tropicalis TaxID=1561998 RepID=A0A1I7U1X3_9PELO